MSVLAFLIWWGGANAAMGAGWGFWRALFWPLALGNKLGEWVAE